MANFALHNTTIEELQAFIQDLPASTTFTVIFDNMPAKKKILEFMNTENQEERQTNTDIDKKASEIPTQRQVIDFSKFEAFGIWADRQDMADSVNYVKQLRSEQWGHQ